MTAVVILPSIIVTPTALLIGNRQTRSIKIGPKPEANADQANTPKAKTFLLLVPLRGSQKRCVREATTVRSPAEVSDPRAGRGLQEQALSTGESQPTNRKVPSRRAPRESKVF